MRFTFPLLGGARPLLAAALFAGSLGTVAAQSDTAEPADTGMAEAAAAVQAMSDYLAGLSSFEFEASALFDEPALDGVPGKRAASVHVAVDRPDRLFLQARFDDGSDRKVWFDGETVTLANLSTETYVELPFEGDVDGLVEAIQARLGVTMPVLMFAGSRPFDQLEDNVIGARLVGERVLGDDVTSLVEIETIDARSLLWIADGTAPLPERLVVTYVREPGDPEYVLTFTGFSETSLPDATFEADVPEGWSRIELNPEE